jgi:hypothetical protein
MTFQAGQFLLAASQQVTGTVHYYRQCLIDLLLQLEAALSALEAAQMWLLVEFHYQKIPLFSLMVFVL